VQAGLINWVGGVALVRHHEISSPNMECRDVERHRRAVGNLPAPSQPAPSLAGLGGENLSYLSRVKRQEKRKRENIKVTSN